MCSCRVWSPELFPFIIKVHSTFKPGGKGDAWSASVSSVDKLAEVSQLLVTEQKKKEINKSELPLRIIVGILGPPDIIDRTAVAAVEVTQSVGGFDRQDKKNTYIYIR